MTTRAFDTPLVLYGPLRHPHQMLAEQEYVGHGSIDPYAAVTVQPPDVSPAAQPNAPASTTLATPTAPASPDRHGATVALIGTAVLGVGLVLGFLAWFPLRRRARAAAARGEPDEPAAPTE